MFKIPTNRATGITAALAAALAIAAGGTAFAAPKVDGEFPVTNTPGYLTEGPDGNIWVAEGTGVAKVTPAGDVTEYTALNAKNPTGIAAGPDGNIWVSQSDGVAKFSPADPTNATKFTITGLSGARGLTAGPDGNLWAASDNNVIKIPPGNPTGSTAYPVLTSGGARGITSDGTSLWAADFAGKAVVNVTTDGTAKSYPVGGSVQEVGAGPKGQVLYSNPGVIPAEVGRIAGGNVMKTPLLSGGAIDPFGITFGSDDAYWFAEFGKSKLGRFTPDGKYTELEGLSAGSGPRQIAKGLDNTLWVSLEQGHKIARITGVVPPPNTVDTSKTGNSTKPDDHLAPSVTKLSASSKTATFRLSEKASVRISIARKRHGNYVHVRTVKARGKAGRNAVTLGRKALGANRYRLTITASDAAGNKSKAKQLRFKVAARKARR